MNILSYISCVWFWRCEFLDVHTLAVSGSRMVRPNRTPTIAGADAGDAAAGKISLWGSPHRCGWWGGQDDAFKPTVSTRALRLSHDATVPRSCDSH